MSSNSNSIALVACLMRLSISLRPRDFELADLRCFIGMTVYDFIFEFLLGSYSGLGNRTIESFEEDKLF